VYYLILNLLCLFILILSDFVLSCFEILKNISLNSLQSLYSLKKQDKTRDFQSQSKEKPYKPKQQPQTSMRTRQTRIFFSEWLYIRIKRQVFHPAFKNYAPKKKALFPQRKRISLKFQLL